jgi:hypothetical protein
LGWRSRTAPCRWSCLLRQRAATSSTGPLSHYSVCPAIPVAQGP